MIKMHLKGMHYLAVTFNTLTLSMPTIEWHIAITFRLNAHKEIYEFKFRKYSEKVRSVLINIESDVR